MRTGRGGGVAELAPALRVLGAALLGGIAWLAMLLLVHVVRARWDDIVVAFDLLWVRLLALVTLVLVSLGVHALRRRNRVLYAVIEIGAGLAVGWHGFSRLREETFPAVVTVVGAIYVLIRAFDNLAGARRSAPDQAGRGA